MKILAVTRAEKFSPNSVDKDRAIILDAASKLSDSIEIADEDNIPTHTDCTLCLSMARETVNLDKLATLEVVDGLKVVNNPFSVKACTRSIVEVVMQRIGVPLAPEEGNDGYWIKRGDMAAQAKGEVRYCKDADELEKAKADFAEMDISDYVVSAHVVGDLVKWYAVEGGFFRYYYPSDDGNTKFDDETINGKAHHYAFDSEALQQVVEKVAHTIGIAIYGGDAIIRADGTFCIIDFNDWPSFSRCREEAAEAIAIYAEKIAKE